MVDEDSTGSAPPEGGIELASHDAVTDSRRGILKKAAMGGAALWVAPAVLALSTEPASASTCGCTGTTSAQLLAQRTAVTGSPTSCSVPANGSATLNSFCRFDSNHKIYLWGTGSLATGSNGPLFDDLGVIRVTEQLTGTIRYGNIYRFQTYCREGGSSIPTTAVGGYNPSHQRVYTGATANVWDFLPPWPGGSSSGATQTETPTTWYANSLPAGGSPTATSSVGNPGYDATAPVWSYPVDISLLFGNRCGLFNIYLENRNRYQEYKWSNIFIGSTPPVIPPAP